LVSRALNAAWIRPFLFLNFHVVVWDLNDPAVPDSRLPDPGARRCRGACCGAIGRNCCGRPAHTYATICGFLLSAVFGIPVAMLIADRRRWESYVYPLLVFSQSVQNRDRARCSVVWFGFASSQK